MCEIKIAFIEIMNCSFAGSDIGGYLKKSRNKTFLVMNIVYKKMSKLKCFSFDKYFCRLVALQAQLVLSLLRQVTLSLDPCWNLILEQW